jgi:hypothetical protein
MHPFMKIYFVVRWGNPDSPDGPNGADTNLLVRALTVEQAAAVAGERLRGTPTTSSKSRRPVQPFCHQIYELGTDTSTDKEASVIHGPWVEYAYMRCPGCPRWSRDDSGEKWVEERGP